MKESEFLYLLQERAREQERAIKAVPFPRIFLFVTEWLSHHPWRYLIPLAFLVSLLFRGVLGERYTDFILGLFKNII